MDALRKSVNAEKGGKGAAAQRSTRAGHGRTALSRKRASSTRSKVKRAAG